jgi:isopentenyldiphosphate isomerase
VAADELIDWVDEQDQVIGQVTRARMRRENLLHRCIAVMCLDSTGRVYVHRRTDTKDVYPGLHDAFVGGVVGAGESYEDAALREIAEELGVVGPAPEPLFHHLYEDAFSRSQTRVFRVRWDGAITHQPSEVAWGAFCDLAEVASGRLALPFVPDGWAVLQRYVREVAGHGPP